jgi:drug/metabolite transporter (DMT)-like permease
MSLTALGLVLTAAVLHTTWNFILKRSDDRQLIGWWAMLAGALMFAPLVVLSWPLPAAIWPYVLASAVVEVAYMLLLGHAYQHGDFSLVYPVARGSAPALLALWSVLFLGERPSAGGILGLALLLGGLCAIGAGHWWAQRRTARVGWAGIALALGVAAMISIYSAIDAAAVRLADPLAYNAIVFGATGLLMTPAVLLRRDARPLATLRRSWRPILAIGLLMLATYALVLQAYATSTVSYVGAVREIGIVLAAAVGWRWLGERFGRLRAAGAVLTFCGVLAIAALGRA